MKITFDSQTIESATYLLSIGNGWNVGGGLQLTPKAKLDDGLFDLCYIEDISRRRIITNFNCLANGTIDELEETQIFQASKITVDSTESIPMHLDGEELQGDRTHIEISIHPQSQAVIGNWSGDHRFDS